MLAITFDDPFWKEAIGQGALRAAGQQRSPSSSLARGDAVGQQPGKRVSHLCAGCNAVLSNLCGSPLPSHHEHVIPSV